MRLRERSVARVPGAMTQQRRPFSERSIGTAARLLRSLLDEQLSPTDELDAVAAFANGWIHLPKDTSLAVSERLRSARKP